MCMLRPHHTAKQHTSIGLSIPDQGDINNVARILFVRNWGLVVLVKALHLNHVYVSRGLPYHHDPAED